MVVHHRHHLRPALVDLAVDEALAHRFAPLRVRLPCAFARTRTRRAQSRTWPRAPPGTSPRAPGPAGLLRSGATRGGARPPAGPRGARRWNALHNIPTRTYNQRKESITTQ